VLHDLLRPLAGEARCVFIAGLPASGKSLVVREMARLAADRGRRVHLLQWDVARLPFDAPAILARYPEVGGVTHAAIRVAVGRWARRAVGRWHRERPDPAHVLIGETPLIGERLMALARPHDDEVEPLLASDRTTFVVPVPSREVRAVIEGARSTDVTTERDRKSAPPDLVRTHWSEIERVAGALGIRPAVAGVYDPELYAAAYRRILRHRHVAVAPVTRVARDDAPPIHGASAIVPSAAEVAAAMAEVERVPPGEIERRVAEWYLL
jgi:hypothetical protein